MTTLQSHLAAAVVGATLWTGVVFLLARWFEDASNVEFDRAN